MSQRNDPCPCGSGKKYKRCCLSNKRIEDRVMNEQPQPQAQILITLLNTGQMNVQGPIDQ